MERRYHVYGVMHKAILKPSSKAKKTVCELKVALEKIWENFQQSN